MIKKTSFIFLLFCLFSCVHTEKPLSSLSVKASKERVWKVLVKVFKSYPIKIIDEQLGYIETKMMRNVNFWTAPHQKKKDFYGYSYLLKVSLKYNKPFSTVTITKKVYKQKGFISKKQEVPSDHLQETALIYQINRELEVQSLINRLVN